MNDYIIRAIAANDQIRAFAAVTTETVETARQDHNTSPVATAALGGCGQKGATTDSSVSAEEEKVLNYVSFYAGTAAAPSY